MTVYLWLRRRLSYVLPLMPRVISKFTALSVLLSFSFLGSAHAQSNATLANLPMEILETVIYSLIGILMGVVGFKVVDWLTPGDLADEVAHKENRALAILAGSMMLGVCIIIASALVD